MNHNQHIMQHRKICYGTAFFVLSFYIVKKKRKNFPLEESLYFDKISTYKNKDHLLDFS